VFVWLQSYKKFPRQKQGIWHKTLMREKRWPKIKLIAEFCRDYHKNAIFFDFAALKFGSFNNYVYLCIVRMSSEGAKRTAFGAIFQAGPF